MFKSDLWDVDSLSRINISYSASALISEPSMVAFKRQCRHELPSLRFKSAAKFFLQAPGAVCISNDGRRKVDRRGTYAGQIS